MEKKHFKGTKDKLKGDFCEDLRKQLKIFEEKKLEHVSPFLGNLAVKRRMSKSGGHRPQSLCAVVLVGACPSLHCMPQGLGSGLGFALLAPLVLTLLPAYRGCLFAAGGICPWVSTHPPISFLPE